jgi:hypothetical protein
MAGEHFKNSDTNMVLLSIENVEQLILLSQELDKEKINHVIFFEPDNNMGYSSLATKALSGSERKKIKNILSKMNIMMWRKT